MKKKKNKGANVNIDGAKKQEQYIGITTAPSSPSSSSASTSMSDDDTTVNNNHDEDSIVQQLINNLELKTAINNLHSHPLKQHVETKVADCKLVVTFHIEQTCRQIDADSCGC